MAKSIDLNRVGNSTAGPPASRIDWVLSMVRDEAAGDQFAFAAADRGTSGDLRNDRDAADVEFGKLRWRL